MDHMSVYAYEIWYWWQNKFQYYKVGHIICHFIHVNCHSCSGKFSVLHWENCIIWNIKYIPGTFKSIIYTHILLISNLWNIILMDFLLSVICIMNSCINVRQLWYMKSDRNDCNVFQIIIIYTYSTENEFINVKH